MQFQVVAGLPPGFALMHPQVMAAPWGHSVQLVEASGSHGDPKVGTCSVRQSGDVNPPGHV